MKKRVLWIVAMLVVNSGQLFAAAVSIVDWKWDDATERRYTVNSVTPGTMNLLLGSTLNSTAYDPAWVTVGGRNCADFSNYNTGLTYCKQTSSWTSAHFATLAPTTYSIEMICALQTVPAVENPWNSNYPAAFLTLVDTTSSKTVYEVRCQGTAIDYVTAGGTITLDTVGTAYEIAANDWLYLSATYDGTQAVVTVYNMTKGKYGQVTSSTKGAVSWTTGNAGALAVGAEVTTSGTYRRSIDGLIDEVRISSGIVAEEDRLVIIPEPTTLALLGMGIIGLIRKSHK
jgi:hypothetical protein